MRIWSLGSNGQAQLSLGHENDTSSPTACLLPPALRQYRGGVTIRCGGNHTLLLTADGELYGCGSNAYQQLGAGKEILSLTQFTALHRSQRWKLIACGFNFSILVSCDDEIYSTGSCTKGSLGLHREILQTQGLERVEIALGDRQVSAVHAGIAHVVVLLSDGSLLGWGSGRNGALGPGGQAVVHSPSLIRHPAAVEALAVGKSWTAILTKTTLTILGSSRFDLSTHNLSICDISALEANWSTLHMLMKDGSVQSRGRADRGQHPPPNLPPISVLSGGTEHSVAIGADGKVYVWGWNEHGNCGPGGEDVTSTRALQLEDDVRIESVAAGYGSTFICGS